MSDKYVCVGGLCVVKEVARNSEFRACLMIIPFIFPWKVIKISCVTSLELFDCISFYGINFDGTTSFGLISSISV